MYKRGTIVLVPFPFTDLSAKKVRPAIIVSKRHPADDIVLCFISSRRQARLFPMDVAVTAGRPTGLKVDSIVKCDKIATLSKKIIFGELGRVDPHVQKVIDTKLRLLLGL